MELNEIIVFFICILVVLFMQIPLLILGNSNDCYFSDKTIKKLTVPQKSVLRKLVVFKEAKVLKIILEKKLNIPMNVSYLPHQYQKVHQ